MTITWDAGHPALSVGGASSAYKCAYTVTSFLQACLPLHVPLYSTGGLWVCGSPYPGAASWACDLKSRTLKDIIYLHEECKLKYRLGKGWKREQLTWVTASQTIVWPSGVQSKRLRIRRLTSCSHTGGLGSPLGLSAASCRSVAERGPLLNSIRRRLTNTFSSTWVIQVQRVVTLERLRT